MSSSTPTNGVGVAVEYYSATITNTTTTSPKINVLPPISAINNANALFRAVWCRIGLRTVLYPAAPPTISSTVAFHLLQSETITQTQNLLATLPSSAGQMSFAPTTATQLRAHIATAPQDDAMQCGGGDTTLAFRVTSPLQLLATDRVVLSPPRMRRDCLGTLHNGLVWWFRVVRQHIPLFLALHRMGMHVVVPLRHLLIKVRMLM